jgi:hypothetical protein
VLSCSYLIAFENKSPTTLINEHDEIIYDMMFTFGNDDVIVTFKGVRAVSRVPLRKEWFVG